MSSLAELPKVCGFFSYSREDDEDSKGTLSDLRDAIQRELSAQLGRNKRNFRLFQDREAIAAGKLWEKEIAQAIEEAAFFIPIITPRALGSWHCRFEFDSFLTRERELGRDDLVFPILYIAVPALQEEPKSDDEPVLSILRARQYVDWRALRHLPTDTPKVRETIAAFCSNIVETLRESRLTPEERQEKEALVVARRNVDEDRNHVETETSKHVEEEPPSKHEQGKENTERKLGRFENLAYSAVAAICVTLIIGYIFEFFMPKEQIYGTKFIWLLVTIGIVLTIIYSRRR